jgi:type VI secretion system secreted protein Hcp
MAITPLIGTIHKRLSIGCYRGALELGGAPIKENPMKWYSSALRGAALIGVLSIAFPLSAAAADAIFVRVQGIDGDSTEVGHVNWIEALAFGGGVTNPESAVSAGGGTTGRPTFSDVSILKRIDRASPALFLAAAKGSHVASVDIDFVKLGGSRPTTYYKIRLSQVVISGVRTNASVSEGSTTEFVTFSFGEMECTFIPADGSPRS